MDYGYTHGYNPLMRSFRLATDAKNPEVDAIGIGVEVLDALDADAAVRVAHYLLDHAQARLEKQHRENFKD